MRSWSAAPMLVVMLILGACGGTGGIDGEVAGGTAMSTLPPAGNDTATTVTVAQGDSMAESPPATPRRPIVLGFAGDVSFTHGLDASDPFAGVVAQLSAPDLTVVNLETTIAEPEVGSPLDKTYVFKSPPGSVDLLVEAGIDGVSLANNHTLDYRRDGLLRTVELLDAAHLGHFGAGADAASAYATYVAAVGDWTVGFVGFTHVECGWVADDLDRWPEAAWACPGFEPRTIAAIADAALAADVVVVMAHWGVERDHCPQPYQRELASDWIEAGADLVIGSHPHVLQGIEKIGDGWVVHSTGNFAFPSARDASARSAFFTASVTEDSIELQATPIEISAGRPRPMEPAASSKMLADLGSWSFGWSFGTDGTPIASDKSAVCD